MTILLLSSPCRKFCFVCMSFSRSFISLILPRLHPFETMWNVVASHFYSSTNILRATDNGLIPSFLTAIFLVPQKTESSYLSTSSTIVRTYKWGGSGTLDKNVHQPHFSTSQAACKLDISICVKMRKHLIFDSIFGNCFTGTFKFDHSPIPIFEHAGFYNMHLKGPNFTNNEIELVSISTSRDSIKMNLRIFS